MSDDELARERYVNLATFRRDGREVRTPVWIAADGDRLVVYTNGTSGKVKRIRNDGRVRLAPCDARGRVSGDWREARALMRDDARGQERGLAAVQRKYGWQMGLVLLGSKLSGSHRHRAVIEIELETEDRVAN
jgi:PPOX class probable F420-dependent enzyme